MNEQNINTNEEMNEVEVIEDYEDTNSGFGLKIIGGVLATAGVIWGGLKLKKMIKAKKEKEDSVTEVIETDVIEDDNVEVEEKKSKKK